MSISDYSKRYLVILVPDAGCIWSGRALIGNIKTGNGILTLQNTANSFVIVHELGHSLGLGHSNFLRCESGVNDGPWGADCKAVEYGGTVDVMGNVDVDSPLSTYHQWILGYLDRSEIKQSWLSEELELSAADVVGGTRAIFIRDGNSAYWVEYRRASFATNYKAGLVIFRTDPPPTASIESPNPEDSKVAEPGIEVTADYWMLNWDNYTYVRSKASGSMTLPQGSVATTFSGNVSLVATPSSAANKVRVSITRKPDVTPPPTPRIIDPTLWRYPDISVIEKGYEDRESAIAGFEVNLDGKVVSIHSDEDTSFTPTYLNPISPSKSVYLKDLPEGDYRIAIRSVDVWGNKSAWSNTVKAYVDRGSPIVTSNFKFSSIDGNLMQVNWAGAKDAGVGLCSTLLHNQEGFVLARSSEKISPTFNIPTGNSLALKAQVFDCLGNGMAGDVTFDSTHREAAKSKRTGKWVTAPIAYGLGSLRCIGKCSASVTSNGNVSALIGEGSAEIFISEKSVAKVPAATAQVFRNSDVVTVGTKKKVIRVTGTNFVYGGLKLLVGQIGEFKPISLGSNFPDPTLDDSIQKNMARLGFNQQDFTNDWTVLPMARGTTLQDPTLDLCGSNYASESGREIRRQISVTKVGSPYLFLSSEAVKYKSLEAAKYALEELKNNFASCVSNKGANENGVFTDYRFQDLPQTNSNLVDENSRLIVRATIGKGTTSRQLLGFYQYQGAYFTGLYVVKAGEQAIDNEEVLRWFDVASVMANRLRNVAITV
jgi:hypothetical protein